MKMPALSARSVSAIGCLLAAGVCAHYEPASLAPPTAKETRELWARRVQELSKMVTSDKPMRLAFDAFLEQHPERNSAYRTGDHEFSVRYSIFRENVKKALDLNVKADGKAVFGITRFMDLTEGEFRKLHKNGGKTWTDDDIAGMMQDVPEVSYPGFGSYDAGKSRDWRKEGVITPVKDQGQCGSCWAFSTVETVEAAARLADKSSSFIGAPQELVSCDHGMDFGCNGGLPTHAYSFLEKNALESEADYPYTSGKGDSGTCKMDTSKGQWKVTGYTRVAHGMRILPWTVARGEKNMKSYILDKGPMSIGVDATAWQTYQQGIVDAELCQSSRIDHAVQVVALEQGDQAGENGGSYWVVRNSWTSEWGEQGFIRLTTDENTCLITGMATAVTVEKAARNAQTEQENYI